MKNDTVSIKGSKGTELENKNIIHCITGSISIFKSLEIIREMIRYGADVQPVVTDTARDLINPLLFDWASNKKTISEITGKLEFISTLKTNKIDLILLAPATFTTINKFANGIADNPVTLILQSALGFKIPILIVPAMHENLYDNPILQKNIEKLEDLGVSFIPPDIQEDKAKISDKSEIIDHIVKKIHKKDMIGIKYLVTAGPTHEQIDPIRYITNASSGKMGISIAKELWYRGADVTLIHGNISTEIPKMIKTIKIKTTEEMLEKTLNKIKTESYNVFISAAAPSDFKIDNYNEKKMSSDNDINLKFKKTQKIINEVKKTNSKLFSIIFKLEYNVKEEELIEKSYKRLIESNADMVIANDGYPPKDKGFDVDTNEVYIINEKKDVLKIPLSNKKIIAMKIIDEVKKNLK